MKRTLLATAAAACTLGVFIESSPSGQPPESAAVVPYRIKVADNVLRDLKDRLARTRFPDEIPETGWDYGTDLSYLKALVAYWRDKYDWRTHERALNRFDQFTTSIDGLTVHFIHQRAKNPNAMPLALTHGWPGSVYEFTKVIGPLTDPAAHGGRAEDAFHVVAISLPGFGFSDRPRARGYGPQKAAEIIAKLMARLGYTRYGLQGGDWGAIISRIVALQDPAHVAGLHLNLCIAPPPGADVNSGVPPAELKRTQDREAFMTNERAYRRSRARSRKASATASTIRRPGSPAGSSRSSATWCDCDGNVESRFHEGRPVDQCHDLLGHADCHVVRAHLLREPRRGSRPGTGRGPDRVRAVSEGDLGPAAEVGGGAVQPRSVDGDASRRPLCRPRAARAARGRREDVFPHVEITRTQGNSPVPWLMVLVSLLLLVTRLQPAAAPAQSPSAPVVFTGADLITDGDRPVLRNSALLVEGDRIAAVGPRDGVRAPANAIRVDLSGKTVMPALVNLHGHVGYQKGNTFDAANYTRDNILDQLGQYTYYGVGAVLTTGTDPGDLTYQLRAEPHAGALLRTAGRGFAAPNGGPGAAAMREAAFGVTTEDDARRHVRELAAKKPDFVKIWVDDRNGTVQKLSPALYRAIIDEAHARGLKVMAHVYTWPMPATSWRRASTDFCTSFVTR